jgi:glutathione-specific gamma-glutamylcyclotransferase
VRRFKDQLVPIQTFHRLGGATVEFNAGRYETDSVVLDEAGQGACLRGPEVKELLDRNRPEDLWVFGYGSLMWNPGFNFVERVPARLIGLHRALCVYSFVHRGTPERPGLVLGLDRGGMCRGIAFRVASAVREETVAYLRAREQVTTVYVETMRRIELEEEARRQVRALCFIVDRSHVQYAGRLTLAECVHHVRQGHGRSGPNRDYVLETVQALEALGYRETDLHLIAERLKGQQSAVS